MMGIAAMTGVISRVEKSNVWDFESGRTLIFGSFPNDGIILILKWLGHHPGNVVIAWFVDPDVAFQYERTARRENQVFDCILDVWTILIQWTVILGVGRDKNAEVTSCGPSVKSRIAPINAFGLTQFGSSSRQSFVFVPSPNIMFAPVVHGREKLNSFHHYVSNRHSTIWCNWVLIFLKPRSSAVCYFSWTSKVGRRDESV